MAIAKDGTQRPYKILHRFLLLRRAAPDYTGCWGDAVLAHALGGYVVYHLTETKDVRTRSNALSVQSLDAHVNVLT